MKVLAIKYGSVVLLLAGFIISCNNERLKRNKFHPYVSMSDIIKGKALAIKYCQSCHLLPDPSWVDSKTWEKGILPNMGPRFGIFHYNGITYPSSRFDLSLRPGFYPSKPLLTSEEWRYIMDYYVATSPDTISTDQHRLHPIKKELLQFSTIAPSFKYDKPGVCFVKIDSFHPGQPVITSDAKINMIYRFNKKLELFDSIKTNGPVVDIEIHNKEWLICDIGILNPNNGKFGSANHLVVNRDGPLKRDSLPLFNLLQRPVQITGADLNNDGRKDYVICEFGFQEGALSWMENTGDGKFKTHILRPLPGAIKAYVQDYNHDGLKDIWVLFSQGEEGVFLFTNKGNGEFLQQQVLRFPPIYGSSYFELDDFNKDGYSDILYTCGDNADYSTVLKPFHGVYIFMNDRHNNFQQKYFFPINGCYKAMAEDFDGDGDLDIAAISYFADYQRQPEEAFVYLQNQGNYDFLPFSSPDAQQGRWLTMDAGDFDGDGLKDLILGNFSFAPSFMQPKVDWKLSPPFIILRNTGSKQ